MDNKATFYSSTPEQDTFASRYGTDANANAADNGPRNQLQGADIQSGDSEDEITKEPLAAQVVGRPAGKSSYPVSINADPPVATESGFSTPIRARSRIWAVIGSLHRDSSLDQFSRTPHRCQSSFNLPNQYTTATATTDANEQEASETEPLLHSSCGHMHGAHAMPSHQSRRSRQVSTCSITDLPSSSSVTDTSASGVSASSDDETSGDSHCHSKQQRSGFDKKARTKLILASIFCLLFMTGEMVGGFLAHSLAIISDAAHLLTDFASFMISLLALYLAHRPATKKLSFGWYRIEILGAFVSILMLWVLTGILVYSAVQRIMEDNYEIDAKVMLITAATGVAFNIILGTTLHQHSHSHGGGHGHSHGGHGHSEIHSSSNSSVTPNHTSTPASTGAVGYGSISDIESAHGRGSGDREKASLVSGEDEGHGHSHKSKNINVQAAFIHVIGDLFQSVGVLVAAFIIYYKPDWKIADPICTFMFSLFVLITTITIMRDILVVLMEGTPRGINFREVRDTFFEVEGVLDIHNLRVWSLTMDKIALSVHLAVDKKSDPHRVLKLASLAIQRKYNISETTMQIEEYVTEMVDCTDCKGPKL